MNQYEAVLRKQQLDIERQGAEQIKRLEKAFSSQQNYSGKNISISLNNALLGKKKLSGRNKKLARKNPYKDYDKDGIINVLDCNPSNPNQHGIVSSIKAAVAKAVAKAKAIVKLVPIPAKPVPILPPKKPIPVAAPVGGYSRVSPLTGKPEYVLSSGAVVPVTPETTKAIAAGKADVEVMLAAAPKKPTLAEELAPKVAPPAIVPYEVPKEMPIAEKLKLAGERALEVPKKVVEKLKLGKVAEAVLYPIKIVTPAGIREEEAKVPTAEEIPAAYYPRPTVFKGKYVPAGAILTPALTPGVLLRKKWTEGEVSASFKAGEVAREEIRKASEEAQTEYSKEERRLIQAYYTGDITYPQLSDTLGKKAGEIITRKSKEAESKISVELKEIEELSKVKQKELLKEYEDAIKLSVGEKVITGAIYGAATAIPYYGPIVRGAMVVKLAEAAPELTRQIIKEPVKTAFEIAPYIAGGMIGAGLVSGVRISIRNSELRAEAIAKVKAMKIDVSHSFSVGKAARVGTDARGNAIWNVEVKSVSKLINRKTGKTVDTLRSTLLAESITSPTKSGAVKSTINAISVDLRRGGLRYYKTANKITMKAGLEKIRGTAYLRPSGVEDIFTGYGRYEIMPGELRLRALPERVELKAKITPIVKQQALANMLARKLEAYPEVKILQTKKGISVKLKGTEEIYKSAVIADVFKTLQDVRGYEAVRIYKGFPARVQEIKVKPYVRKPAVEPAALREEAVAYLKAFTPEELIADIGKVEIPKPPLKVVKKVPEPIAAQVTAQAAAQANVQAVVSTLIEGIKKVPVKVKVKPITVTRLEVPVTVVALKQRQAERLKAVEKALVGLAPAVATKAELRLRQAELTRQAQLQEQMTRQMQMQQQQVAQLIAPVVPFAPIVPFAPVVPVPSPAFPAIAPPFPIPLVPIKPETESQRIRRAKLEAIKLEKQARAYQASVGAAILGLTIEKEKAKELAEKQFTGLELRPVIKNRYGQMLARQQRGLMESAIGTSRKGSPRKATRDLRSQYLKNLDRMFSYAKQDKARSMARTGRKASRQKGMTLQGESREEYLKRLKNLWR